RKSSITTNPKTEFDIKLFQTVTRELSQEFPDPVDNSNPVQEDIHDFLPEHATVHRRTRDKRKSKTSKLTVAN
ncbi:unnamed protein product, partial [Hymenolepis diminuta]